MLIRLAIMLGIALSAALAAHVAFSAAAAYRMASFEERIFDVRSFQSPDYPLLIGGYLGSRGQRPGRVAIGSSFTHGFPFAPEFSFPKAIGAANVAVLSGDLAMSFHASLCQMKKRGMRASQLILEVPLVNEVYSLAHYSRTPIDCDYYGSMSLFEYALRHVNGLNWWNLVIDPYQERHEGELVINQVTPGYFITLDDFARVQAEFVQRMRSNYLLAQELSDDAYLFVTPVLISAVEEAGDDPSKVQTLFDAAQAACIETAGEKCIRMDDFLTRRDLYYNLTHLNIAGNLALSEAISAKLAQ